MGKDSTKDALEQLLAGLYKAEGESTTPQNGSYLLAQNNQFLGKITTNSYDRQSILNEYGPFGSPYSPTSIFNEYSQYGSPYGTWSINNPYCTKPPRLFIRGKLLGHVSRNQYVSSQIPAEAFLYALRHRLNELLAGKVVGSESEFRQRRGDSYIEAQDGTFLGTLSQNPYDTDSIFNRYGQYGSSYSPLSIFNRYGNYGSLYSDLSPFNQYSQRSPRLFIRGKFAAFLTKNRYLTPHVDPDELEQWVRNNVPAGYY